MTERTLGVLGAGQLAQMLALAAVPLGVKVVALEPGVDPPASLVAQHLRADYTYGPALDRLAACDAVTVEFENVPVEALANLAGRVPVRPAPALFAISRHRLLEKNALTDLGVRVAPYAALEHDDPEHEGPDAEALASVGGEGIVKTVEFGYDGKGQRRVRDLAGLRAARRDLGHVPSVLEGIVPFVREVSLSVARSPSGELAFSGLVENVHAGGILRRSTFPAASPPGVEARARDIARRAAEAWGLEGLLTLEFFELEGGELLVNEVAPRVHNSGHLTQDGGGLSQFEAQVRAVLDLPLRDFAPERPCAMVNLLGREGGLPDPRGVLRLPRARLHLYHKENRPGRKIGHVNVVADTPEEVRETVEAVEAWLEGPPA